MHKKDLIHVLTTTGIYLKQHALGERADTPELSVLNEAHFDHIEALISTEHIHNPWFTEESVRKAMAALADSLSGEGVEKWLTHYPSLPVKTKERKKVGVVMAGNIPMVGFHDFISVLASGHHFLGKTSSKDERLIPSIARLMTSIDNRVEERLAFTDEYLKEVDAIIATGSDNSSRYFEYYFKNIPHIIRKNRNGVAVLTGEESDEQLLSLGEDIFSYFGLGCRNVTKLYVPESFDLTKIMRVLEKYIGLSEHNKYANNIDYNRSVYLMNLLPFLDNGALILKEQKELASPVGVVFYEKYSQLDTVIEQLKELEEHIQCIVSIAEGFEGSVSPGESQTPALWDYADGVDTMSFLSSLIE